jgi:HrpA-like RNA helicase
MILEAKHNGCVREVLIITAALSIQDPRERPADAREAADAMHKRFAEPGSDFLALLNLWAYVSDQQRELSGSAFRRMCRREYLHYLRIREWTCRGNCARLPRRWASPLVPTMAPSTEPDAGRIPPTGCTCRCWRGCCRTSG